MRKNGFQVLREVAGKQLPKFRRIVLPSSRSGTVLGLLDPDDEGTTIFSKTGICELFIQSTGAAYCKT
jgi:hypothetical protein